MVCEDSEKWRVLMRSELSVFDIEIIAEATNGLELLEHLKTLKPDVILLDLSMPIMDGNETLARLNFLHPTLKVIIMSLFDDATLMDEYSTRCVRGCISKTEAVTDMSELYAAIRRVHKGGVYWNFEREIEVMKLTIRQKEIVGLVGDGKTTKQIAKELGLTERAVSKQIRKVIDIMKLKNFAQLGHTIAEKGFKFFRKPKRNML